MAWYGPGTVALIAMAFMVIRRVPAFLTVGAAIVGGFAAATYPSLPAGRLPEWVVTTTGLAGWIGGLSIVRAMLSRSVSLQLLARIDGRGTASFGDHIGDRLHDLRAFHLSRSVDGENELTPFGQLVAGIVAVSYWVLRIET